MTNTVNIKTVKPSLKPIFRLVYLLLFSSLAFSGPLTAANPDDEPKKKSIQEPRAHYNYDVINVNGNKDPDLLFQPLTEKGVTVSRIKKKIVMYRVYCQGNRYTTAFSLSTPAKDTGASDELKIFQKHMNALGQRQGVSISYLPQDKEKNRLYMHAHFNPKAKAPAAQTIGRVITKINIDGLIFGRISSRRDGTTQTYTMRVSAPNGMSIEKLIELKEALRRALPANIEVAGVSFQDASTPKKTNTPGQVKKHQHHSCVIFMVHQDLGQYLRLKSRFTADLLKVMQKGFSRVRLLDIEAADKKKTQFSGTVPVYSYHYRLTFTSPALKKELPAHLAVQCAGEQYHLLSARRPFLSAALLRYITGAGMIFAAMAGLFLLIAAGSLIYRKLMKKEGLSPLTLIQDPFRHHFHAAVLVLKNPALWLIPAFPWFLSLINDILKSLGKINLNMSYLKTINFQQIIITTTFLPQDYMLIGSVNFINPAIGPLRGLFFYLYAAVSKLTYAVYFFHSSFLFIGLFIIVFLMLLNYLRRVNFSEEAIEKTSDRNFLYLIFGLLSSLALLVLLFILVIHVLRQNHFKIPIIKLESGILIVIIFTFLQSLLLAFMRNIINPTGDYNPRGNILTAKLFGPSNEPKKIFDLKVINETYRIFFRFLPISFGFIILSTFFFENIFTVSFARRVSYDWLIRYMVIMFLSKALLFFYFFMPYIVLETASISDIIHKSRIIFLRSIQKTVLFFAAGLLLLVFPYTLFVFFYEIAGTSPLIVFIKYIGFLPFIFTNLILFTAGYLFYKEIDAVRTDA